MSERLAMMMVALDLVRKGEHLVHQLNYKMNPGVTYKVVFTSVKKDEKEDHQITLRRVE